MDLTIIISYYQKIENLELILKAFSQQSQGGFEVIVSEDDHNQATKDYLSIHRSTYPFPIVHLHQKVDNGFRKNEMLNKSILQAKSERIAFIDGDCVPHRHFVKEYIYNLDDEHYCMGRALMMSEKATKQLLENGSLKMLNVLKLWRLGSERVKDGVYFPFFPINSRLKGLIGRNWGIMKKNLIAVNGFDEDYINAGVGEDTDVEWRLKGLGLKKKSIKNRAIVYHLYHPRSYSDEGVQKNYRILAAKQKVGNIVCERGISGRLEN